MRHDAVNEPALERRKISFAQILGATGARIAAVQVEAPEVVIPDRELAEHVFERFPHVTRNATRMLGLDLAPLRMRNTQQAQGELTRQRPAEGRSPHRRGDALVINRALLIQRAGAEQRADVVTQARPDSEISLEGGGHEARKPMEIEA